MGWKYIMVENKIGETKLLFPIIFPDNMVHADVYKHLRSCMPGWRGGGVEVVSAGKIGHIEVHGLSGGSETLGVSAGENDASIIETYSYLHGIVGGCLHY